MKSQLHRRDCVGSLCFLWLRRIHSSWWQWEWCAARAKLVKCLAALSDMCKWLKIGTNQNATCFVTIIFYAFHVSPHFDMCAPNLTDIWCLENSKNSCKLVDKLKSFFRTVVAICMQLLLLQQWRHLEIRWSQVMTESIVVYHSSAAIAAFSGIVANGYIIFILLCCSVSSNSFLLFHLAIVDIIFCISALVVPFKSATLSNVDHESICDSDLLCIIQGASWTAFPILISLTVCGLSLDR